MTKKYVSVFAAMIFIICVYAFLLSNDVFEGMFKNDPFGWYFLAKGIFCALSLSLTCELLEVFKKK